MGSDTGWFKSNVSSTGGSCVEVRITDRKVYLRDTKNRDAGMLEVSPAAWACLVRLSANG
jgi:Domain of unknown function (DUF397)